MKILCAHVGCVHVFFSFEIILDLKMYKYLFQYNETIGTQKTKHHSLSCQKPLQIYKMSRTYPWREFKKYFFPIKNDLLLKGFKYYTHHLHNWDEHSRSNPRNTIKKNNLRLWTSKHGRTMGAPMEMEYQSIDYACNPSRVKVSLVAFSNHVDTSIKKVVILHTL
jgi:hypothetical protein